MSYENIKKIAVIGAGAMGSGIAAQAANAGYDVVLLDNRPTGAQDAIDRMKKAKPTDAFNAGFMHPSNARRVTPGNTDEHMGLIADADIIIEAVFERLDVKQNVFRAIYDHAKKDAIISSNTSTIQLEKLTDSMPDDFKARFVNTHFFNPVRFMHLLEVITGDKTTPETLRTITDFGDRALGKKVIKCKDSPGFIANRIGIYAMEVAAREAVSQNMVLPDIDALMGPAFGFTNLGLFKLADEVGIDIINSVRTNLMNALPADDEFAQIYNGPEMLDQMIADGYTGRHKGKGGYYRIKTDENGDPVINDKGKKVFEAKNLTSDTYETVDKTPFHKFNIKKHGGFQAFFESEKPGARFAWTVLRDTILYAMNHAEEFAYDTQSVDDAMKAGFGWKWGPFELVDQFGVAWFTQKMKQDGLSVPAILEKADGNPFYRTEGGRLEVMDFSGAYVPVRREEGVIRLEDIKANSTPLVTHNSASLWDIGDGVVCLEFHSEQNSIDPSILWVINESVKKVKESNGQYQAMVIYNDGERFSLGAALPLVQVFMNASQHPFLKAVGLGRYIENKTYDFVQHLVYQGQSVYSALKYAPFPVIGAPKGTPKNMAMGGGCEVLLHCDALQAGPEQIMVLPEAGLGLLPAWGGSTTLLDRAFKKAGQPGGPMPAIIDAAMAITRPMTAASTSSQDAKRKMWLRPDDGISMNPDRVLADAKARALAMAPDYAPPSRPTFFLPGASGKAAIRMNVDSLYLKADAPSKGVNHIDVAVVDHIASVLTGGETLNKDDISVHTVAHHDRLRQIMDERGENRIGVNPVIELTEDRILQLERDHFLDRFRNKTTWKRIAYTLKNNVPLREDRLDPAPTPASIREKIRHDDLPRKSVTGAPLTGDDEKILRAMADMTTEFYAQKRQRSLGGKVSQGLNTLGAVKKVFGLS